VPKPGYKQVAAEPDLAAGDFSSWLAQMEAAIRDDVGIDVPCGGCTACCTSSQFVHVGPDEEDTLAHIPPALLAPAPRLPPGHQVLGFDERGHCPMLIDNRCSIYEHRPRACRTYDCRILTAAGVAVDDDKPRIARQAKRWRFAFPSDADLIRHNAVRAAANYVFRHPDLRPEVDLSAHPTQVAVTAVSIHQAFLQHEGDGPAAGAEPDPEEIRVAISQRHPGPSGQGIR
jgi:hypothetical protein